MEYYNFGAGPGMLPKEVVEQIRQDLPHWKPGLSVMEVSHRSPEFLDIVQQSEILLRELLKIPNHYKIIFPTGGSRAQFSMVPLNLLGKKKNADYVLSGLWSTLAYEDASKFCNTAIAASSEYADYLAIPSPKTWVVDKNAAYLHYTDNETVNGIAFDYIPDIGIPLVADMTSSLLSKPIDVEKFGVIYSSAQKNLGTTGITVVIVREDLLKATPAKTPPLYDYSLMIQKKSMLNTPPVFSWYVLKLVLEWVKKMGGTNKMLELHTKKSKKLYDYIDQSDFYSNNVSHEFRSKINIPFLLKEPNLEEKFKDFARQHGILQIGGHRTVGGMRASSYNAMPEAGIDKLITVMQKFATEVS